MGISLIHTLLELLLLGTLIRVTTYLILAKSPDSAIGKYLAFAY